MKISTYKTQKEIDKTFEVDGYDLMYGTVEDILAVLDEAGDLKDNAQLLKVIQQNRSKVNDLLKDVFPDMTDEDIRRVKLKDLIPFFMELITYVMQSFGSGKN